MAKRMTDVEIHAEDVEKEDSLDVSVDKVDDRLYLGNLACAREIKILEALKVTHILTIDVVPLPRSMLDRANVHFEYLKLADVPKEDLISHLPKTNEYIKKAITEGGIVLVHCYFGVSRSAAVVIAYIMEKYSLCYEEAFNLVKSKRRFICPNIGFVAQLKLFGHMGYKVDRQDPRFKQFRLKLAGQKLKQVKILPQLFADLVKPDPGLVRERPDPVVYRCRKCRRVVASQRNIIPHIPKELKMEMAKKGMRPPPSKLTGLHCAENGQILIEKLKSLACQIIDGGESPGQSHSDTGSEEGPSQLDGYSEQNLVDGSIAARGAPACRLMWFVEPMAWMRRVTLDPHGKLHCPKCSQKIGSFSWVCVVVLVERDWGTWHHLWSCGLWFVEPMAWMRRVTLDPHGKLHCPKCSQKIGSFSWVCVVVLLERDWGTWHHLWSCGIWFVEPMAWMRRVNLDPHGKLHCPKCSQKIGSFSWVCGCKCPCGQKVAPAFYLVPSKVEWSNIVQNVQVTV